LVLRNLLTKDRAKKSLIKYSLIADKDYKIAWHLRLVAKKLEEVLESVVRGESRKIMLFLPPRHGKSKLASINYPSWILGRYPNLPIIISSYSSDLASDFGRETKDLMNSPVYKQIFETRIRADVEAKSKWLTKDGGGYTAVGVGGSITGKGFKIGIIDDPIKNRKEAESKTVRDSVWNWYRSTFYTRQDGAGAIILILTRWHQDDLAGRLLKKQPEQWEVINFPAIATKDEEFRKQGEALWPDRFPLEWLKERRKTLGPYNWSSLYQQTPTSAESQIFKEEDFKHIEWEEVERKNTRCFITIDPAPAKTVESDYIGVCENYVDENNNWNLKAYHVKENPSSLIDLFFHLKKTTKFEKIGIEQGTYQDVLKPFLDEEMRKRNIYFEVVELKHQQTRKELRIRGLLPRYKAGTIYHIKGECEDLENEAIVFPSGEHDDVIDATAYQTQIAEKPYPQSKKENEFNLYDQSFK